MTKKHTFALLTLGLFSVQVLISQSAQRLAAISKDYTVNDKNEVDLIRLDKSTTVYETNSEAFLNNTVLANSYKAKLYKSDKDVLGFTHSRYQLNYNNFPVHNTQVIVHSQSGKVVSLSGTLNDLAKPANRIVISESKALHAALQKVKAKKYKWEDKVTEAQLRKSSNSPNFTYYPKAEIIIYSKDNKTYYAYKLAIYADEPLYGANVIVDAQTGAVLAEENLIHTSDVPATATTKFSSTQNIIVDSLSPTMHRLREISRGLGIETYDLNTGTSTSAAVDYTNTSTAWTNTTTIDQIGTDAHWGAEMTYDYFLNVHARNSIDNAGFKLISYADYGVGYGNAFWNGVYMTYGSGSAGGFVGLDICGHEISHGLTSKTANLIYQNESGALNESYSDIFGQCIEFYAKPSSATWILGETVGGIRNMASPGTAGYSDPDTYLGTNWYTGTGDNGGVHTNSGVSNFWFYLLSTGGIGVNDFSTSYTVTGLGLTDAARIAFRALTVYYGPNTNYASARNLSIQAAIDLFGPCSNEVYQTKSAWYAVGVGPAPSGTATPVANFTSSGSSPCALPFSTNFYNTTLGGDTYTWDFGDGSAISTATNPVHTYTANGTYNVKLKATSTCAANPDSITKNAYVVINAPPSSTTTDDSRCGAGPVNLTASGTGQQYWYASPTATTPVFIGTNFTPTISTTTTYYVVNTFTNPVIFGGPASPTIGTGANFPGTTAYDSLTVLQPCKLKTVMVQASSTASRTIQLRNNMNSVIQSTVVLIPAGISTVTLNFNLAPGYGYRLGLGSGTAFLWRNSTGVTYPYNIGGLINITGSSQGPNYHFYFYNWEVEPSDCKSPAVASTGTVLPGSGLTVNSSTICSGQSTSLIANGVSTYTWDTGANTSSIVVSPSVTTNYTVSSNTPSCGLISLVTTVSVNTTPVVTLGTSVNNSCSTDSLIVLTGSPSGGVYTGTGVSGNNFNPGIGVGTYTVIYYYTDPLNGCSASSAKTITVSACVGINELNNSAYFKIYPNPANDHITLTTEKETDILFKVFDATGKTLIAKQLSGKTNRIDISSLAKGIYFVEAQDENKNTYRQKIVKQ